MILSAVLMTLCTNFLSAAGHSAYHTVTQYIKMLSIVERQKSTKVVLFKKSEKVQALSCYLHHHRDVVGPCELVRDEGSQEFEAVNPLHRVPIDMQRGGQLPSF